MTELMNETWEEGGDECPECGASAGEKCDPRCSSAQEAGPPDGVYHEGAEPFGKFMDRILNEGATRRPQVPTEDDSLQRKRAARVQERPLGRIRMGGSR